ncbi:PPE family protein [Mycobacterium decipiens]|uniref:PPE family protein n=1 Tax=Mycobacterium decipiens TaxID=1430326 RepID=UPI0010567713
MGSPPEVHSALLNFNYGAGVGPMLDSASHHFELSAQYAQAASEVEQLLGTVKSGGWQGHAAEAFVTAYLPFLAWLIDASVKSSEMAAKHELMAAAYTAAVAAMPTRVELAANHVTHGVLVATNFFGINTIPIAINEEQYVQMWVRAATTMATYDATSKSALSSMRQTGPPPPILKSNVSIDDWEDDDTEYTITEDYDTESTDAEYTDTEYADTEYADTEYTGYTKGINLDDVLVNPAWDDDFAFDDLTAPQGGMIGIAGLSDLTVGQSSAAIPAVAAPGSSPALAPALASATSSAAAAPPPRAATPTSDRGAGPSGFAGTVRKEVVVEVAGLTTLAGDDFGGSPTMPMLPGTWAPDPAALTVAR